MTPKQLDRLRKVVLVTIVWLLVVYEIHIVTGAVGHLAGLVGVLASSLAVAYCRWRAGRGLRPVRRTLRSYVWLYLPSVPAVLAAIGIVVKLSLPGPKRGLAGFAWDLLPFLVQLGVPVAALTYAYVLLLRSSRDLTRSPRAREPDHR